jgi:hypothetical protein
MIYIGKSCDSIAFVSQIILYSRETFSSFVFPFTAYSFPLTTFQPFFPLFCFLLDFYSFFFPSSNFFLSFFSFAASALSFSSVSPSSPLITLAAFSIYFNFFNSFFYLPFFPFLPSLIGIPHLSLLFSLNTPFCYAPYPFILLIQGFAPLLSTLLSLASLVFFPSPPTDHLTCVLWATQYPDNGHLAYLM